MRSQLIGNGLLAARVSGETAAVLEALQLQGASLDRLLSLDDAGWVKVLRLCDRMQLTLPLALRSSNRFPNWVRERLTGNLADSARRFVRVQATYREAAAALDGARVSHVVLKGFTQSPNFVKAPQFRMQGDIDFYMPSHHVLPAVRALEGIGYEPAGPAEDYRFADHCPTLIRFRGWTRSPNLFDPEAPLALEVHHCLWNELVFLLSLPEVESFWNRRIHRTLGDMSFPSLSSVDHLGYFALHLLRDVFAAQRLVHHTLELATFLHERADDPAFWKEWQALHSPQLRRVQAVAFALAGTGFSSRFSDTVNEEIARLPAAQHAWIEMCAGDMLAEAFRRTRDGRILQFLLAESSRARRKILWRAVSPGVIVSPRRVARWSQDPAASRPGSPSGWAAYLARRIPLHSAAVLRFVVHGLAVALSGFALRRDPVR